MNERIKKLAEMAEQATKEHFNSDWDGTPRELFDMYFNEKFAELIIQECRENFAKVWYEQGMDIRGADLFKFLDQFEKHFGVEE